VHEKEEKLCKVLLVKPEGKRLFGILRRRWVQNGSWGRLAGVGYGVDSVGSGLGPVAGSCELVMNLWVLMPRS
jgi:hypothetical protein